MFCESFPDRWVEIVDSIYLHSYLDQAQFELIMFSLSGSRVFTWRPWYTIE